MIACAFYVVTWQIVYYKFNSLVTFMEPFPVGLVVTLVSAAILRRNPGAPHAPARASALA